MQSLFHIFSELCEALYALKRVKFAWTAAASRSFELLKEALGSPLVLAHSEYSLQFDMYCDASAVGVGTMLAQKGRPITFALRILNAAERNYSITERECLSVIWALKKFCCLFTQLPVKDVMDYAALRS